MDDDVRDAHLLGELQVFFAECVEAELETEFHGRFSFLTRMVPAQYAQRLR